MMTRHINLFLLLLCNIGLIGGVASLVLQSVTSIYIQSFTLVTINGLCQNLYCILKLLASFVVEFKRSCFEKDSKNSQNDECLNL